MSLWLPRHSPSVIARIAGPRHVIHPRIIAAYRTNPHVFLQPLTHRLYSTPSSSSDNTRKASTSTHSEPPVVPTAESKSPPQTKEIATPKAPLSTRVWAKVKHEAQHYWHGSKLLVSEVRISGRLQWKLLHGDSLTRRERRQASAIFTHTHSIANLRYHTRITS